MSVIAPGRLRAEAADRPELGDAHPHRLHDPPAAGERAERRSRRGREDDPERDVELGAEVAGGEEQHRDDAHRLLRVVACRGRGCRRRPRRAAARRKSPVDPAGRRVAEGPQVSQHHARSPRTRPMSGASTMNRPILMSPAADQRAEPGLDQRRAGEAADERVRRAGRQPPVPGDEVPRDGADQAGEDHPLVDDVRSRRRPCRSWSPRCTPKPKAATKLKKAAHTTACSGVSTRVDTTVAMELAASWKPLMKSKTRATRTMKTTRSARTDQAILRTIPSITLATSSQRSVTISIVS